MVFTNTWTFAFGKTYPQLQQERDSKRSPAGMEKVYALANRKKEVEK